MYAPDVVVELRQRMQRKAPSPSNLSVISRFSSHREEHADGFSCQSPCTNASLRLQATGVSLDSGNHSSRDLQLPEPHGSGLTEKVDLSANDILGLSKNVCVGPGYGPLPCKNGNASASSRASSPSDPSEFQLLKGSSKKFGYEDHHMWDHGIHPVALSGPSENSSVVSLADSFSHKIVSRLLAEQTRENGGGEQDRPAGALNEAAAVTGDLQPSAKCHYYTVEDADASAGRDQASPKSSLAAGRAQRETSPYTPDGANPNRPGPGRPAAGERGRMLAPGRLECPDEAVEGYDIKGRRRERPIYLSDLASTKSPVTEHPGLRHYQRETEKQALSATEVLCAMKPMNPPTPHLQPVTGYPLSSYCQESQRQQDPLPTAAKARSPGRPSSSRRVASGNDIVRVAAENGPRQMSPSRGTERCKSSERLKRSSPVVSATWAPSSPLQTSPNQQRYGVSEKPLRSPTENATQRAFVDETDAPKKKIPEITEETVIPSRHYVPRPQLPSPGKPGDRRASLDSSPCFAGAKVSLYAAEKASTPELAGDVVPRSKKELDRMAEKPSRLACPKGKYTCGA